jgi:hypothetical protein
LGGVLGGLAIVAASLLPTTPIMAQEMDLPVDVQWSLLDKVLVWDRAFASRTEDGTVVGVLYQSGYRPSLLARDQVLAAADRLEDGVLARSRITLVPLDASTPQALRAELTTNKVDLLYVAPLRAYDLRRASAAAAELGVVTFTGVREFMTQGMGIGAGLRGGRREVLVNLEAARAQGMDLDAQLLGSVTVIKRDGDTDR